MKMYQILKQFGLASIVWLVVFVCDYAIELFRIDHTGTVVTAFGLKMDTTMTEQELSTVFSLTSRAACVYAIFVGLWMLVYLCLSLYDKKKK